MSDEEERERLRWVPVTERLPDEGVSVVVYSPNNCDGEFHVCEWCVERKPYGKPFEYFSREDYKCIWGVTHWMPLPEIPVAIKT
jgi:hypothetical protein